MSIFSMLFLFLIFEPDQSQRRLYKKIVDHHKDGKAIILHAGGEAYSRRYVGTTIKVVYKERERLLLKFSKQEIDIFTYCY